jgi:XrtJ-associated TM-motif-TM protein
MKRLRSVLFVTLIFLAIPIVVSAQGGCVDSPEAPTDVLLLVGSIGMIFGSSVVIKALRNRRKQ